MRLQMLARNIAILVSSLIVLYIIAANTTPINIQQVETMANSGLTPLTPIDRVVQGNGYDVQVGDLVYFYSTMLFKFDHANVKFVFKNPSASQNISLGYQDQQQYHYNASVLDAPFLNTLNWPQLSNNGLYLYQKTPVYKSVSEFLMKPPTDKAIGVFDYDFQSSQPLDVTIPGYKPAKQDTIITTPLRGKTTFYAYVQNEPFHMILTKRDLNWYAQPDVVSIKVYKGSDVVAQTSISDDGNESSNHVVGVPQQAVINNPGPGLPENGVYKIVIDAPGDTITTRIQTNLHKLAFAGPLYPVSNAKVYGGVTTSTTPTTLYTDAPAISAQTYHTATQTVQVGLQGLSVTAGQPAAVSGPTGANDGSLVGVIAPLSDTVINGVGYFSFTPDQFFAPTPYKLLSLTNTTDLSQVDYVITHYPGAPKQLPGGWDMAQRDFDLSDSVTQGGKLSWLISAPGLSENGQTVKIKSIDITLTKKGWFK
jgi:hypothetical protein